MSMPLFTTVLLCNGRWKPFRNLRVGLSGLPWKAALDAMCPTNERPIG